MSRFTPGAPMSTQLAERRVLPEPVVVGRGRDGDDVLVGGRVLRGRDRLVAGGGDDDRSVRPRVGRRILLDRVAAGAAEAEVDDVRAAVDRPDDAGRRVELRHLARPVLDDLDGHQRAGRAHADDAGAVGCGRCDPGHGRPVPVRVGRVVVAVGDVGPDDHPARELRVREVDPSVQDGDDDVRVAEGLVPGLCSLDALEVPLVGNELVARSQGARRRFSQWLPIVRHCGVNAGRGAKPRKDGAGRTAQTDEIGVELRDRPDDAAARGPGRSLCGRGRRRLNDHVRGPCSSRDEEGGQDEGEREGPAHVPRVRSAHGRVPRLVRLPSDRRPAAGDREALRGRRSTASATRRCSAPPGPARRATMAWVIEQVQKPTLVIAHNKTLAAQLCNEFREFFPDNAVEYFVSLLRLLPARGVRPAGRPLHREGRVDQRRHRPAAALGDLGALPAPRRRRSSRRCRASTPSARRRSTASRPCCSPSGRSETVTRCCASSSTSSTSATTRFLGPRPLPRPRRRRRGAAVGDGDGLPDLVLRRRGRADHPLRPADRARCTRSSTTSRSSRRRST